jgi:hypothetical protein
MWSKNLSITPNRDFMIAQEDVISDALHHAAKPDSPQNS